jgi:YtkA-like
MRLAAVAIALGLSGLLACSSSSHPDSASAGDDSGAGPDTSGLVGCDDPRVQTYSPNMSQPGASAIFTFVLVSSDPAPPADETNVLTLQVLDASGQPVTGATVTAVPTMPLMSHGTSTVTVTPNADGSYTLQPVYLFMAGLWEIAIKASSGGQTDTTSYYFCVAG